MTMDDREAIRELLYRINRAVDTGDAEAWASSFAPDGYFLRQGGSFDLPDKPIRGYDKLLRMAKGFRADGLHFTTNELITVDGDRGTASSYVMVLHQHDDPRVRLGGIYEDELTRIDGSWRIASRTLLAQFQKA